MFTNLRSDIFEDLPSRCLPMKFSGAILNLRDVIYVDQDIF